LDTDRSSIVWPPIAILGGVNAPPAPTFSLTRKWGVDGGGCVCVWWACDVEDELLADDDEADAEDVVDELLDGVALLAEAVVCVVVAVGPGAAVEDGAADFDDEWLPDPHAATSSAVISAAPMRFTIGAA
jgi:hypothetical protein